MVGFNISLGCIDGATWPNTCPCSHGQAEKLEDRRAQDGQLVQHTALGLAAVSALLEQTSVDTLGFSDRAAPSAGAGWVATGLSWVFDVTHSITEAAAGVERVKAETAALIAGLAEAGLLSPDVPVRYGSIVPYVCPGRLSIHAP